MRQVFEQGTSDHTACLSVQGGGTPPAKFASDDSCKCSSSWHWQDWQQQQPWGCLHPTSSSLLPKPTWSPWLGIYAPLRQAALMNCFQDDGRVCGIHLTQVSTFSFKSLFRLASICSLLTAQPGSSWGRAHSIHVARGNSSFRN